MEFRPFLALSSHFSVFPGMYAVLLACLSGPIGFGMLPGWRKSEQLCVTEKPKIKRLR